MDNYIELLKLEEIKLPSINKKYGYSPKMNRLYLNSEYRHFKDFLRYSFNIKEILTPKYAVLIKLSTYKDIDASIKVILDAMEGYVIDNDKNIIKLTIYKNPVKRGSVESLEILINDKL